MRLTQRLIIGILLSGIWLALAWYGFGIHAYGQTPIQPGDVPTVTQAQPVPINPRKWTNILAPALCPDGSHPPGLNICSDGKDGFVWGWNSFKQRMELRPPKILYGPGAITSNTGLTQNAWNNLFGAVGTYGFRGGLTAYVPRGNYAGWGQVAIAGGGTANAVYTIRVLMGTYLQTSGSQKGILIIPQIATNGATAAGTTDGVNNVLSFASTTGISPGMVAYDVTNAAAIGAQIVVCSVTSTTVKLTSATAYPSCTASGYVTAPGVSSGDTIMFGYNIGGGGPYAWPGAAGLPFTIPYFFNTQPLACLATDQSNEQCEIFVQIYTTGSGDTVLSASGQWTNPPYSTNFMIFRLDGGYGAN